MSDFAFKLGLVLRGERRKKKMTQGDMSQAVGLSIPTICNIENGKHNTELKSILKLTEYHGITLNVSTK